MQLNELVGEVPAERAMVVHDYHADGPGPRAELALEVLQVAAGAKEGLEQCELLT